ncbi:Ger(x)C family spore germination protein [Peribacillus sp. NPDC097264]|uniref:Ger(x)C family spore germination protein n=1 Tax=Peribacillus sp. NPDC097264 TaxID=3390616 RepID=UPI003D0205DA
MNTILSKPIKKAITVTMLCFFTCTLSGCWGSKELSNMALVMAAGIDITEEDQVQVTIQVFIPRAASSQQQGAGPGTGGVESLVLVKSATGENMADAMVNLQKLFSRQIFWGHCDAFIFGEKFALKGHLNDQIDFINRHPQPWARGDLFISKGPASEILELVPALESYMGDVLQKSSELYIKKPITVKDFQLMTISDSKGGILPLLEISKPDQPEKATETITTFSGVAIFKEDKMVGSIKEDVTQGLLWIRNQNKLGAITTSTPDGRKISVHPLRQSTKLIPKIENGKWSVTVDVNVDGLLVQNGSNLDIMEESSSKQIETYLQHEMERDIEAAITEVRDGMGTDAFGIAESFHQKYPEEWEKVKDHWKYVFPQVTINMDIHLKVQEPGLMTKTLGTIKRGE